MLSSSFVSSRLFNGTYCNKPICGLIFASSSKKYFSSSASTIPSYVLVERDPENSEIAVVKLARKPVNSMNGELLKQFNETLSNLEKDSSVRAVILTSAFPRMFSAGLDLFELYKPKREKAEYLWSQLQQTWISLYGSRLATVAAINGETFAGGCLLAMTCDYRIMAEVSTFDDDVERCINFVYKIRGAIASDSMRPKLESWHLPGLQVCCILFILRACNIKQYKTA